VRNLIAMQICREHNTFLSFRLRIIFTFGTRNQINLYKIKMYISHLPRLKMYMCQKHNQSLISRQIASAFARPITVDFFRHHGGNRLPQGIRLSP
jgi:hypothetical protein